MLICQRKRNSNWMSKSINTLVKTEQTKSMQTDLYFIYSGRLISISIIFIYRVTLKEQHVMKFQIVESVGIKQLQRRHTGQGV